MIRGKFFTSMDRPEEISAIRRRVFVEEMGIPAELEADSHDDMAVYALVLDENDTPAGTGRMYIDSDAHFVIGRVCTLPEMRGRYLGDLLMRMLLYRAQELHAPAVYLTTPLDCVSFFARYGFKPVGKIVEDEFGPQRFMCVAADEIDLEGTCGGKQGCAGCQKDCASCEEGEDE